MFTSIRSGRTRVVLGCLLCCLGPHALGCGAEATAPATQTVEAEVETTGGEVASTMEQPIIIKDVGFMTPESVLYDATADVYLVSNIQGSPLAADDQAFISRVSPDGKVLALKWIDSQGAGVALDAPKGMALVGNVLYVADITCVRKFDRESGKPLGTINVAGSTFLNDIAAAADGSIYVSDSGFTTGFAPSGTDAVVHITADDKVKPLIRDVALGHPNGLLAAADGVWVVTFGSGEMYRLDAQGKRAEIEKLPKGSLDGIIQSGKSVVISSWEASALYSREGNTFKELVSGLDAPADLGFDTKRQRVLVPLFNQNAVVIHPL